ncbi:CoA-transferase family III domain-containing protein [Flammula alnicola]|nr:CoA-transferase family III domain-containing protein [Flammula alnicola]
MTTISSAPSTGASAVPDQLKSIWISNGLPERFISHLKLTGNQDAVGPSSFRLGLAAQISIGLAGLSAAYVHYLRTGVEQDVTVDARHAVLSFHSEAWYTVDDAVPSGEIWDNIAGLYQTKEGGWVRIHTNFPHHRAGVLDVLNISETPDSRATKPDVARAILTWDGQALEEECAKRGMCVFKLRTFEEWERTEQGQALADTPVVDVRSVGEAPNRTFGKTNPSKRPLAGVKVLDLSRVLAGPVGARALAAHEAEVLLITSPNLPSLPLLDVETSLGKRTTQLDLKDNSAMDREKFVQLVKGTDVFLQAYRPRGIEARGFGVADVVKIKQENKDAESEGAVYASLRAWGWDGPWAGRRGFDSLVQTATGFNADEGKVYQAFLKSHGKESEWTPRPLPMQALDHAAGYFLTFGVNVALARMLTEGRSHEVRISLAAVGKWIRSLAFGPHIPPFPERTWPLDEEIGRLSVGWTERWGKDLLNKAALGEPLRRRRMTALRQAAVFSVTPAREGFWTKRRATGCSHAVGCDDAVWLR